MKIKSLNFKTMKSIKFYAMAVISIAMLASCSKDNDDKDTDPVEDEEAITKLVLTFTNQNDAADTVVLTWDDANGDEVIDANEKTIVGEFNTGGVYDAVLELFNKDEDFLDEDILANQASIDAHFFVYATSLEFTMARAADDSARSDNNKLGVKTTWTAGATAATGDISVQLFHQSPTVSDSDGFGTAAGTDTDIDISFDVEIQ